MKEITTKSGKLLLVKVPENAIEIEIIDSDTIFYVLEGELENNKYTKFGQVNIDRICYEWYKKFSKLQDEDFKEFVLQWGQDMNKDIINSLALGFSDIIKVDENGLYYKDYLDNMNNNYTLTPKQSFQSLVKSQGLDDNLDNYLIIKVL